MNIDKLIEIQAKYSGWLKDARGMHCLPPMTSIRVKEYEGRLSEICFEFPLHNILFSTQEQPRKLYEFINEVLRELKIDRYADPGDFDQFMQIGGHQQSLEEEIDNIKIKISGTTSKVAIKIDLSGTL